MNKDDPNALTVDPVQAVINAFGTLSTDQKIVALAVALLGRGALTDQQLRTAVFRVSGKPMG